MGGDSRKLRLLSPGEAKTSLASKLSRIVDRARQIDVKLGMRPYNVFLVWTKWTGDERGEGVQRVVCRSPLLPTPVVADLTSLSKNSFSAGRFPVGSVRVSEISARYTTEMLEGKVVPERVEDEVPQPFDFFWEIVEDGRHDCAPLRRRFSVSATPFLDAPNQQWIVVLERQSGDMERDGQPVDDPVEPAKDPWTTRELEAPEEDD